MKVKIEQSELNDLINDRAKLHKALILLQAIQDMARQSEQIDPGYHAILELLRESNMT